MYRQSPVSSGCSLRSRLAVFERITRLLCSWACCTLELVLMTSCFERYHAQAVQTILQTAADEMWRTV